MNEDPSAKTTPKQSRIGYGVILPSAVATAAFIFAGILAFSGGSHYEAYGAIGVLLASPVFFIVSVVLDLWVLTTPFSSRSRDFRLGMAVPGGLLVIAIGTMIGG